MGTMLRVLNQSVLFVFFILAGHSSILSVTGQDARTLSLHSSLERSNRKFACPLESVSFTCSINGTILSWEMLCGEVIDYSQAEPQQIYLYRQNDSVGTGFTLEQLCQCPNNDSLKVTFSGVLENIISGPQTDPGLSLSNSVCNSSMIITPQSLDVSSDCSPLTIICKPETNNNMSVSYKIAGQPTAPQNLMCSYHEYSCNSFKICLINVTLNVTDILLSNNATEVSFVSIRVINTNGLELPHNFSINPNTKADFLNVTFYHECFEDKLLSNIQVDVIIFDKCGQQSFPQIATCSLSKSKDSGTSLLHKPRDWPWKIVLAYIISIFAIV